MIIRPYTFRNPLFPHNFLVVFLAVRIRHAQHVHASGDGFHGYGDDATLLGRIAYARHHPSLHVIQRNVRYLRAAAQFDEQNIIGGVRVNG